MIMNINWRQKNNIIIIVINIIVSIFGIHFRHSRWVAHEKRKFKMYWNLFLLRSALFILVYTFPKPQPQHTCWVTHKNRREKPKCIQTSFLLRLALFIDWILIPSFLSLHNEFGKALRFRLRYPERLTDWLLLSCDKYRKLLEQVIIDSPNSILLSLFLFMRYCCVSEIGKSGEKEHTEWWNV